MGCCIIDGEIGKETFAKLLDSFNNDVIETVYFKSQGGDILYEEIFIHLLNNYKPNLIAVEIKSCAFNIFFSAVNCERSVVDYAIGMCHQGTTDFKVNEFCRPAYYEDVFARDKHLKITSKRNSSLLKPLLTEKQIRRYNRDKDIYFDSIELRELLEKQNARSKEIS